MIFMAKRFKFIQVPNVSLKIERSPDGGRSFSPALLGPSCGVPVAVVLPRDKLEEAATHGGAL